MALFCVLKFGAGGYAGSVSLTILAEAGAYLLTIYLFYGIAYLSFRDHWYVLLGASLGAVIFSFLLSGIHNVGDIVYHWGTVLTVGIVTGRLAENRLTGRTLYFVGLILVSVFGVLWLIPQWPRLYQAALAVRGDLLTGLHADSTLSFLGTDFLNRYSGMIDRWSTIVIRLLPLVIIMNSIMQYSIGVLWFASVHSAETGRRQSPMRSFIYWRMPAAALLLVLAAVTTRFVSADMIQLAADNLLAALSIFYCLVGFSVLEYHLRRSNVHWCLKTIAYLLLIPTGLFGLAALVGLGLVNNLYDWRKPLQRE
jgi:hypothetical protein